MTDVLIIDDDEIFGEMISSQLELAGLVVHFHHGWYRSVVQVKQLAPRVVIIDYNMPGMRGATLLEQIRSSVTPTPMLMLMSSMDQRELEDRARECGADAAITKSSDRSAVQTAVDRLLKRAAKKS